MIVVIKKEERIEITIPKKFSEKHIGSFINDLYDCLEKYPNYSYNFDFTHTEWIANQNLLLLSGLIKYLYNSGKNLHNSGKKLNIKLLPDGYKGLNKRKVEAVCELWYTWQFINIFDKEKYDFANYIERFGNDTLETLCKEYKVTIAIYKNKLSLDLYDNQISVIPFVSLNYIENARYENTMNAQLKPVYDLNSVINKQLKEKKCEHPFVSKTLSAIITKELYDNFLDHFVKQKSIFQCNQDWAFMSISLKRERIEDDQELFKSNFNNEEIRQSKSFFFEDNKYKNENLIQFSFLDFGAGIVETLKEQYKKENKIEILDLFTQIDDNDVLKYAFKHNSSRNPILDKYEKVNKYIPRGLYDLLVIVKRYNGLLIARSNYGKILYNFSEADSIENSFSTFDKEKKEYFPGTYITIYIPAWKKTEDFDKSVIQPEYYSLSIKNKPKKSFNINLFSLESELSTNPDIRYKQLIEKLSYQLDYNEDNNQLTYINFFGVSDRSIIEKTIFFLLGNYEINTHNSIVIVYPPSKDIIQEINNEVLTLDGDNVIQDFKINPIPVIYFDIEKKEIDLEWIGVFSKKDKKSLNSLLYEIYSLAITDLEDGYKAIGNTNRIDTFGNFSSRLPIAKTLLSYYEKYETVLIETAINEFNCMKESGIYLCNGTYYQDCFLQLTDVLNSKKYGIIIPLFLLNKIELHVKIYNPEINNLEEEVVFIAITASSHKILKSILFQKNDSKKQFIKKENCLLLDSYIDFENEIKGKVKSNTNYILVCDAIATGKMTKKLDTIISEYNSKLIVVAVIVNTLDDNFETYNEFKDKFIDTNKFIELYKKPILKLKKNSLNDEQKKKELIRINPYTNIPITLSEDVTFKDSVLLTNKEFLECIEKNDIDIRFKLFNNLIHPYFFRTAEILQKEKEKVKNREFTYSLIYKIFEKLKEKEDYEDANFIFYPKNSDIECLEIEQLQIETKIFGKGGVKYFELERYNPGNGWKFPHTTEYFRNEIENNVVMILDDGSCSGDSLYQMVNELSYHKPKTINVLSIIGRVEDHRREFFSKIETIKTKIKDNKSGVYKIEDINIHIYFGTHWHIPTFHKEINPYREEYDWVKKVLEIQNTPKQIWTYANNIKNEITPKTDEELKQNIVDKENIDYKYFPNSDDSTLETKKELLKIRDEIGKIIGYRFYKESFAWFTDFINKTDDTDFANKDTNKDIEHLFMCLVYEPYLYKSIIQIIPEIKELMYNFIESFIFKSLNINAHLNYKWRKIDIVHLYFIAYSDKSLVKNLTVKRFEKLTEFIGYEKIDYVLFKILYYSPKNKENYNDIFKEFRRIIGNYSSHANKKINLFKYFISSIPYGGTFEETIDFLKDEYRKILSTSPEHKESISAKLDSAASNIDTYIKNINSIDKSIFVEVKEDLEHVIVVLGKILTLTDKYQAYFSKYITWFEQNDNSLRSRYNSICNYIEDIETMGIDDMNKMLKHVRDIKGRFCNNTLAPYNIFRNPYTLNIVEVFTSQKQEFLDIEPDYNIEFPYDEQISIVFPQYILEEIIIKGLLNNFKEYADKNHPITINIIKDNFYMTMEIKNRIAKNSAKEGSYIGTHLIKKLNDCPNKIFEYDNNDNDRDKQFFIQTLKFKKLEI